MRDLERRVHIVLNAELCHRHFEHVATHGLPSSRGPHRHHPKPHVHRLKQLDDFDHKRGHRLETRRQKTKLDSFLYVSEILPWYHHT